MKTLAVRLAVALVTFTVGVWLTALLFRHPAPRVEVTYRVEGPLKFEMLELPGCDLGGSKGKREETPEQKAVRLAEEFVARNGYTDLPPDREHTSYESVEWESNFDEMLKFRHDTLARKAYGIRYTGKMNGPGWTVAFRPASPYRCGNAMLAGQAEMGRVVTMDENFENLRVEHKDFPLANVHKKF
jgi:hypothetical protein